jgi:hypothetical protein
MDFQTFATGALGGVIGGGALWAFLGNLVLEKEKAKWNKELETVKDRYTGQQKRLQAQLDNSVFVTRAHFEVELQAMREVHRCLGRVKIAFRALDPLTPRDEKHAEQKTLLIENLRGTTDDYFSLVEEWGAFLEPSLYDSFMRSFYGADEECKRLRGGFDSHDDRSRNHRQFLDNYRAACQGIRDRLKSLAILPGT